MRYLSILCLLLTVCSSGCGKKKMEHASFFTQPSQNRKNIVVKSITLDTIPVVLPNTSYMGYSEMMNGKIYFADTYFCWVYEFDKNMQLVARRLGQGRGPREIPIKNFSGYAVSRDGDHYFVGSTRDIYIYDSEFNFKNKFSFMPRVDNAQKADVFERDDFYSLNYDNMIIKPYKNHLYFNVVGGNEEYNILNSNYYFDTRILMEVNIGNGEIEQVLGRLSPSTKYMSAFWQYQYDMDEEGNFYVSFEPDSLIYVYNNKYDIKYSFGHSGIGMNTDYLQLTAGREYGGQSSSERENKGYYSSVKKIGDYVFRTYKTGNDADHDRLQIYKDRVLTGDVEVPAGLSVMGYIAPYYYSHIVVDEYDETLTLYRFKPEE